MDFVSEGLASIPQSVLLAFAGLGALFTTFKALSFLRLLLNTFVLSGTNVSIINLSSNYLILHSIYMLSNACKPHGSA